MSKVLATNKPTTSPYAGLKKKAKAPPTAQALYKSLLDQLVGGFHANALKTCDRILHIAPTDALASQTRTQLLLALDRFPDALSALDAEPSLERVYCLYKTGREHEAQEVLGELDDEVSEERAAKLLQAQVSYRLEDYEHSRDLLEELVASADPDSPEYADLQTNLSAAQAHLDFLAAVPSRLASSTIAPIEQLESTPIGHMVQAHPAYKTVAPVASTSALPALKTPKAPRRLPKKFDPTKKPDRDRWLPMKQRPGMAEEIVRRREQERGRKKGKNGDGMTQGAAEPVVQAKTGSGGGGGGGKRKKGKK